MQQSTIHFSQGRKVTKDYGLDLAACAADSILRQAGERESDAQETVARLLSARFGTARAAQGDLEGPYFRQAKP